LGMWSIADRSSHTRQSLIDSVESLLARSGQVAFRGLYTPGDYLTGVGEGDPRLALG
jgi:hypothetical protein